MQELHGVTPSVSKLTISAIAYLSVYPLIDAIVRVKIHAELSSVAHMNTVLVSCWHTVEVAP